MELPLIPFNIQIDNNTSQDLSKDLQHYHENNIRFTERLQVYAETALERFSEIRNRNYEIPTIDILI